MFAFQWTQEFETGIETVDEQHHRLVDTVNQYGELVAEGRLDTDTIPALLEELLDYAKYHFDDEEKLMENRQIDPRHISRHRKEHTDFVTEIVHLNSRMSFDRSADVQHLLDFLIHWLSFHILGADQNMARQIDSCSRGMSASEAYVHHEVESAESKAPLITALNNLFSLVSERNRDLVRLKESLEQKVRDRTKKLEDANWKLEQMALTDVLTGLYNRRYAVRSLESLWEESDREDRDLACIMIDADNFKQVNDTYGHDAGDLVLTKLAETMKDELRTDDILCRLGGDEFIVICPATGIEGVSHLAEILLGAVTELTVDLGSGHWQGQVSIGTAVKTADMERSNDLIKSADGAVYGAKRQGRNRICSSTDI